MGHERIGFLPRSKQWTSIVNMLSDFDSGNIPIAQISYNTLNNIKKLYEKMPYDESVIKSILFLTLLSISSNKENPEKFLNKYNIAINKNPSLFSILKSAKEYITTQTDSLEINKIAVDSVLNVLTLYARNNETQQISFFPNEEKNIWQNIGTGTAFCDLARGFFANFTDHYLRYFLEREAAHSIDDYKTIECFSQKLTEQTQMISTHAFETSKIMQSFAAGWFNKYAVNGVPSVNKVSDFLNLSFKKMRAEFQREAEEQ